MITASVRAFPGLPLSLRHSGAMGCFVNTPLRSNALHTAAFISTPFTMTKHLFSLSCLLTLCLYLSGSHYNLTKYTETYFPIREGLRSFVDQAQEGSVIQL